MRDEFGADFKAALGLEILSLCYLFEITLKASGVTYYYTDASESLYYAGNVYRADAGIDVSAIRDTLKAFNQTATIEIGYRPDLITEEIVRKGGLDGATHSVKVFDYRDISKVAEVFSGRVDRVTASNPYSATVDLTGWQGQSVQTNGVYSMKCRNVFCDEGCTLNIEDYSHPFVMTGNPGEASTDGMTFGIGLTLQPGILAYGSVEWTTGRNVGVISPIAWNDAGAAGGTDAGQVKLMTPTPYRMIVGDEGILREGCDFYAETCQKRFNNLKNLEAEPAVPIGTETTAGKTENVVEQQDPVLPPPRPDPVYPPSNDMPMWQPPPK